MGVIINKYYSKVTKEGVKPSLLGNVTTEIPEVLNPPAEKVVADFGPRISLCEEFAL